MLYNVIRYLWGISAVGSAQHWQCWGQGFESPILHQARRRHRIRMAVICYTDFFCLAAVILIYLQQFSLRSMYKLRNVHAKQFAAAVAALAAVILIYL